MFQSRNLIPESIQCLDFGILTNIETFQRNGWNPQYFVCQNKIEISSGRFYFYNNGTEKLKKGFEEDFRDFFNIVFAWGRLIGWNKLVLNEGNLECYLNACIPWLLKFNLTFKRLKLSFDWNPIKVSPLRKNYWKT